MSTILPRIEKLQRSHNVDSFTDCGEEALNEFLIKHAFQSQQSGGSQTYVALVEGHIVGFYTFAYAQIEYAEAPARLQKGLARHPIPVMLLARLAVCLTWAGKGLGSGLLRDAMLRTLNAAEIAGLRALTAHAKNDKARAFYEHFDFVPSPTNPYHLALLLKDVRGNLQERHSTREGTSSH